MKLITLNTLFSKAKLKMLVVLSLSIFSMATMAATAVSPGKPQTDRFNHMTTGFPLTGAHLITECSSCHVEGVFKGTPRDCAGCHTKGRKVIATPMSAKHIPTSEACDVCHSNAVTFLGTRYNHGRAVPGQCTTCHNGHIAAGRPASHSTPLKASKSCDSCHRTFVWLPATWNHMTGGSCDQAGCHLSGSNQYFKAVVAGTSPKAFAHNTQNNGIACASCHSNYFGWFGARYDHAAAGPLCSTCHNGSTATGIAQKSGHVALSGQECSACHVGTVSWLGAIGAMPSNHIPFNVGTGCGSCHTGTAKVNVNTLHLYSISSHTCAECHISPNAYTGNNQSTKKNHEGSSGNNCTGCHKQSASYSNWSN